MFDFCIVIDFGILWCMIFIIEGSFVDLLVEFLFSFISFFSFFVSFLLDLCFDGVKYIRDEFFVLGGLIG